MDFVVDRAITEGKMSAAAKDVESTGRSSPLGATVFPGGVNFSVYSRNASGVEVLLFDREDDALPARVITIDSATNVPTIIGMCSCRTCNQGNFTGIESTDHSTPRAACGLIPARFSSIRMGAA